MIKCTACMLEAPATVRGRSSLCDVVSLGQAIATLSARDAALPSVRGPGGAPAVVA